MRDYEIHILRPEGAFRNRPLFGDGHCDISDCVAIVAEERPEHGE